MDTKHSRRLLAVGAPDSGVLEVIKDLSGSAPASHDNGSTAGLTHEWNIQTAYYSAKVPIWIDEIPDVEAWRSEFMKPEAKEVVEAIGAWVYCFKHPEDGTMSPAIYQTLKAIQEVSDQHAGYGADVVMLAVALPSATARGSADSQHEEREDLCLQYGFEYINYSAQGTNDFGEKVGFERLKEALEANEWASALSTSDDDELNIDDLDFDADENDVHGFARDEAEMTAELFSMKAALVGRDGSSGDDDFEPDTEDMVPSGQQAGEVEDLDRLMGKLLAVKEQSADLPVAQRKRLAAKAVRELYAKCSFHYYHCDGYRYPDTSILYLASECSTFLADVKHGSLPTRAAVLDMQKQYVSSTSVSPWELHGRHTFVRCLQDKLKHQDVPTLIWEILPTRSCVRVTPMSNMWICDGCMIALTESALSGRSADAGEEAAHEGPKDIPTGHMTVHEGLNPLFPSLTTSEEEESPRQYLDSAGLDDDVPADWDTHKGDMLAEEK